MLANYPQFSPQTLMGSPFGATQPFGYQPGFGGFGQPGQFGNQSLGFAPQGQGLQPGQGAFALAQQLVVALAQLAHQISIQSVVSQQIGASLQHLTQQIQSLTSGMPGVGVGQLYGQPYGQQPFVGGQPAWQQAWGGQRTQTIQ